MWERQTTHASLLCIYIYISDELAISLLTEQNAKCPGCSALQAKLKRQNE